MTRSKTECFGMNEIRCVTVNVETHIASMKTDDGVWLGGSVVHHHLRLFDGTGGGRSLLRAHFFNTTGMVGSTEREIKRKVPEMLCTRVMPRFQSFGTVVASGEYWTLAPYAYASYL